MKEPTLDIVHAAMAAALPAFRDRPMVIGLCGAQGSGKSTVSEGLASRMREDGIGTAILSIDDLYLTKAERAALAAEVHPLFATRGVPGTHDVGMGLDIFTMLDSGIATPLPAFDKAIDDRAPEAGWRTAPADTRLIVFEGWCVGARAQSASALEIPVNALERDEDPDGVWRGFVNDALAGAYQRLFERIDYQILLAAPGFEIVEAWRTQQEHDLRARSAADAPGLLSDAAIRRFIQHYERLTRHILDEMPGRADLVIDIDANRVPLRISGLTAS